MIDNFPKKNICVMCPKISLYNYFLKFEEVYAKSFNFARPRNVTVLFHNKQNIYFKKYQLNIYTYYMRHKPKT